MYRLHSSDIHRCVQGIQLLPVVLELVVVNDFGVIVFALEIDTSEKFNHVVYKIPNVARVLVQNGS